MTSPALLDYPLICVAVGIVFLFLVLITPTIFCGPILGENIKSCIDARVGAETESLTIARSRKAKYGAITRCGDIERNSLTCEEEYWYLEYQEIREGSLSAGGEAGAHTPVANTTTEDGTPKYMTVNSPRSGQYHILHNIQGDID